MDEKFNTFKNETNKRVRNLESKIKCIHDNEELMAARRAKSPPKR